jgi:hypothetical protein
MSFSYSMLRMVKLMVKGTRRGPNTAVGAGERLALNLFLICEFKHGICRFLALGQMFF